MESISWLKNPRMLARNLNHDFIENNKGLYRAKKIIYLGVIGIWGCADCSYCTRQLEQWFKCTKIVRTTSKPYWHSYREKACDQFLPSSSFSEDDPICYSCKLVEERRKGFCACSKRWKETTTYPWHEDVPECEFHPIS